MRTLVQRVVVTFVSAFFLTATGALAGYLLGRAVVLRQAEARLDRYANRILLESISSSAESRRNPGDDEFLALRLLFRTRD